MTNNQDIERISRFEFEEFVRKEIATLTIELQNATIGLVNIRRQVEEQQEKVAFTAEKLRNLNYYRDRFIQYWREKEAQQNKKHADEDYIPEDDSYSDFVEAQHKDDRKQAAIDSATTVKRNYTVQGCSDLSRAVIPAAVVKSNYTVKGCDGTTRDSSKSTGVLDKGKNKIYIGDRVRCRVATTGVFKGADRGTVAAKKTDKRGFVLLRMPGGLLTYRAPWTLEILDKEAD